MDSDGRAMTLAPRTYLSHLTKNVYLASFTCGHPIMHPCCPILAHSTFPKGKRNRPHRHYMLVSNMPAKYGIQRYNIVYTCTVTVISWLLGERSNYCPEELWWCSGWALGLRSKRPRVLYPVSQLQFQRSVISCFQLGIWLKDPPTLVAFSVKYVLHYLIPLTIVKRQQLQTCF